MVGESSDLYQAQPITFDSMRLAKEHAESTLANISISLLSCHFPEDDSIVPEFFEKAPYLSRSVKDLPAFSKQRKLPFIKDILQCAYGYEASDYVIFTNVDISLYPNFYVKILPYLEKGYDGICINRNTLKNGSYSKEDLPRLWKENWEPHEGIDCFVVKRNLIPKMILVDSIVGTGPVGLIIAMNLVHLSQKFIWLTDGGFTFHIGDDKLWLREQITSNSLLYYNFKEFHSILTQLHAIEKDSIKRVVLTASLDMADYFLAQRTFLNGSPHRTMLQLYSKMAFEEIVKLGKETQGNTRNIKQFLKRRFWNL